MRGKEDRTCGAWSADSDPPFAFRRKRVYITGICKFKGKSLCLFNLSKTKIYLSYLVQNSPAPFMSMPISVWFTCISEEKFSERRGLSRRNSAKGIPPFRGRSAAGVFRFQYRRLPHQFRYGSDGKRIGCHRCTLCVASYLQGEETPCRAAFRFCRRS